VEEVEEVEEVEKVEKVAKLAVVLQPINVSPSANIVSKRLFLMQLIRRTVSVWKDGFNLEARGHPVRTVMNVRWVSISNVTGEVIRVVVIPNALMSTRRMMV
jgi:hypothetical protein